MDTTQFCSRLYYGHIKQGKLFGLCADDFSVKVFSKHYADCLLKPLSNHCAVSTDWEGRNYPRLTID